MKSAEREHYGLAVYCAKRFEGRGVGMEDLIAEAEAALLYAASRFDESRGVRFSTYAIPVTLGALRELCRRQSPMHVPREDRRLLARAAQARERLFARTGREPDVAALAAELDTDAGRLGEIIASDERMRACSGDETALLASEPCFEDALLLRSVIRSLPSPYAQVIWLRCAAGLSQQETALRLGATQPQISRWETKGRSLLRELL